MASSVETVTMNLNFYQPNQLIVANDFYKTVSGYITEATFYKTLERLCDAGRLVHLSKGIYYRPKTSRFGTVPISETEISNFYLQNGSGIIVGYRMYNKKGLTTQISKKVEILSSSLKEQCKNIQNVSVRRISVQLNARTIPVIETLETLQAYSAIEDLNTRALYHYMAKFASEYSDETFKQVVARVKYKKSTIAFLAAFLNHFHIENSLSELLSPVSSYKIPNMEVFYEFAQ